jgi:hypothetical protein
VVGEITTPAAPVASANVIRGYSITNAVWVIRWDAPTGGVLWR